MAAPGCVIPTYRDASWKGVAFLCETSDDEFGRRGDQYEYPLSEDTGYKDMGRKIRRFKLTGYLIGSDQVEKSNAMARAAESPQPGTLVHPMFGGQQVACVTLKISADYRRDIKRTKLDFDFVEANASMAPYAYGASTEQVFASGSAAIDASTLRAIWQPNVNAVEAASAIDGNLAMLVAPADDEESFDVISVLEGRSQPMSAGSLQALSAQPAPSLRARAMPRAGLTPDNSSATFDVTVVKAGYITFEGVVAPITEGTATIRRLHTDAVKRLHAFNAFVVEQSDGTPSVESLIVSARLSLIRDYALAALQTAYQTVTEAILALDFVMAVYDDEERLASSTCYDVLVTAIRKARADAARAILTKNIRLPGIVSSEVHGQWPSVVVSHKLYVDGRRYAQVESYNAHMVPFYIGSQIVAPAS
jgi:prophage DNA circulation protein